MLLSNGNYKNATNTTGVQLSLGFALAMREFPNTQWKVSGTWQGPNVNTGVQTHNPSNSSQNAFPLTEHGPNPGKASTDLPVYLIIHTV